MRFLTFLLAAVLALTPSFVLAEFNENAFTAPLAGDIVTVGKPFQVRWINIDGGIINLVLVRGDPANVKTISAIAAGIPNTGVFNWNVPEALEPRDDYAIEIQAGVTRNYTPLFKVIADPGPNPDSTDSGTYSPPSDLVEKTTDSGAVLTESYPIDPTTVQTETAIVTSDTTLIFPVPTSDETEATAATTTSGKIITLDASNTYSITTITYPTTLETMINGSSTTYVGNGTMTTSSLISPTSGNDAGRTTSGIVAYLAMLLAVLWIII
ncbi:hypothetical protein H072_95 [Dactylellina haptotyla CBS 200.50]|uniref:Yeast cell wall synthesis Kre9/Knh1-like N-terminal domain-containing protein n=1 Tax=Dactylellina haptotyla (strain CBS 200.50) TaxID=1284197 RepID=S8ASE5_DACHA|nr:hypothetical protein H072_95 [Dactylellina haptotyla CBS 200.50]